MKRSVRQNRFGNWRGYEGGKYVREFAQERAFYVGNCQSRDSQMVSNEMPSDAKEWLKLETTRKDK